MKSVCSTVSIINVFEFVKMYTDQQLVDWKRICNKVKMNFHCLSAFIQLSHHLGKRQLVKHVGLHVSRLPVRRTNVGTAALSLSWQTFGARHKQFKFYFFSQKHTY